MPENLMPLETIRQRLRAVISIPITPFGEDGRVDFDVYSRLVARMVEGGIGVVTPNGNTGEFYSLTAAEQRRELEVTAETVGQRALILAGVGYDAATAADAARHAAAHGAQAVMVHQPVHPYKSDAGWLAYHQAIADAVPALGVVPYLRDATLRPSTLARLADRCPNFVGIKYAVPNPLQFASTVHAVGADRLTWVCGLAESWAPFFWPGGASGFTSGLVNLTAEFSLGMQHALEQGDTAEAMRLWALVRAFEELRARHHNGNNVSVVKEAMAQMGLCRATVRPPIGEVTEQEKAEVAQVLAALGLDEFISEFIEV